MKVRLNKKIGFDLVGSTPLLTLHNLAKLFQETAIKHSKMTGSESKSDFMKGRVWILYQYGIEILKWPVYEEEIEIITWHREMNRYKAYREFEVYSGDRKIASASGVYIFFDMIHKKIKRIPEEAEQIYSVEDQMAFGENLDHWRPVPRFDPQFEMEMTTRSSDFDLMGHVNNASYFDFVETALSAVLKTGAKVKNIKICYAREMNQSVFRFKSAIAGDAGRYKFKIFDENTVFAYGEFETE